MSSTFSTAAVVVALVYLTLRAQIHFTQDADEPPAILTSIPFFSSVLRALRHRQNFWMHLLRRYKLPIYTLRLPFARLYIVNDPALLPSIDRQSKVLSFSLFEADIACNLLGISKSTHEELKRNSSDGNTHIGSFNRAIRRVLTPGPALESMNQRTIDSLTASLDKLRRQRPSIVALFDWVQHEMVMAITDAEYGAGNPFRDPEFEQTWYEYESHVTTLSITPTKLLPRAAIQAREFLVTGFERYLAQGQHHNQYRDDNNKASNVSPFLYTRYKHHTTGRLTPTDIARWELLTCLALLFNTAPAAFWLIYHLISDPVLLAQCRAELEKGAVTIRGNHNTDDNDNDNSDANNEEGAHGEVKTLSLDWIRRECPLLMVTLHEVFRFRGIGMPVVRRVLEDHRLGGRWVLRKGGIVLIPTSVIHFEEAVWGKDAGEFKPARFLKSDGEGGCVDGVRMRKRTRTLRVFGGGATRCPGREFVQSQILAFAALMVLQFELKPIKAGDGRQWVEPQADGSFKMGLSRAFPVPERDFDVEICARQPERECRVVVTDARGSA